MLLTELIGKPVRKQNVTYGNVTGVCVSLKSRAIRYLLCISRDKPRSEFAVGISAVAEIDDDITLTRLKPLLPQNSVKLTLNRPIYDDEGKYLGFIKDAELENGYLHAVYANDDRRYAATRLFALDDAVLLKKAEPYPLGQRIPAPALFPLSAEFSKTEKGGLITRSVLKNAIKNKALIRLTLNLPPFTNADNE